MDWNDVLHLDTGKDAFYTLLGAVPPEYTYERDGRAGMKLTYLPHNVANRLLLEAFGPYFSWEILEIALHGGIEGKPECARATGRLTLYVEVGEQIIERKVTGVGAFDNTFGLPSAAAEASAASMALPKALIRAFGFGLEHYEKDDVLPVLTPEIVWSMMIKRAAGRGVGKDTLAEAAKTCGIDKADWVRQRDEMFALVDRLDVHSEPAAPVIPEGPVDDNPFGDPVVEAAKDLGAVVVDEIPDWGTFFTKCGELGIKSATEANRRLDELYGQGQRPKSKGEMFADLRDGVSVAPEVKSSEGETFF